MRVWRAVSTYIWNDDKFPFTSDDCKLVWFHLFTNPLSSPLGVYRATIEGLAADLNRNKQWPLERYQKAFQEAFLEGFLKGCDKHLLIGFPKYFSVHHTPNHPANPNVVLNWAERYHDLPDCDLKAECYQSLKALLDTKGEGFQEAFTKAFGKPLRNPSERVCGILIPDSGFLIPDSGLLIPHPKEGEERGGEVRRGGADAPTAASVQEWWNAIPGIRPCKRLDGALRKRIVALCHEHPASWWETLFAEVAKSRFLTGRIPGRDGKRPFRANLEWATGPINLGKILAGNYDDSEDRAAQPKRRDFTSGYQFRDDQTQEGTT